jgi:hypothetical protein
MEFSAAWTEFEWVPDKLIANWVMGVKSKHEQSGWDSMPGILWDQDTMTFIGCSNGLMEMLKVATKSWRSNKRHEAQTTWSRLSWRSSYSIGSDAEIDRFGHFVRSVSLTL